MACAGQPIGRLLCTWLSQSVPAQDIADRNLRPFILLVLLIWTEHARVPVQAPPLQPAKTDPEAGTAVSVTVVPPENGHRAVTGTRAGITNPMNPAVRAMSA